MYGVPKTDKMINSVKKANSKKVFIDGVIYNSFTDAKNKLGFKSISSISYGIKSNSERYKNWYIIVD